jgi:hypothetical protein
MMERLSDEEKALGEWVLVELIKGDGEFRLTHPKPSWAACGPSMGFSRPLNSYPQIPDSASFGRQFRKSER